MSGSWLAAGKRAAREFSDDVLQDRAAALTYYGMLAIFPALLVLVSLLGLIGKSATQPLIANLAQAAPSTVRQTLLTAVDHLQRSHASAGVAAIIGIVAGLWSASSYIGAFMRASNAIYDVPEGRPAWKTLPIRLGVTIVMMVLVLAAAFIIVINRRPGASYRPGAGHRLGGAPGRPWWPLSPAVSWCRCLASTNTLTAWTASGGTWRCSGCTS